MFIAGDFERRLGYPITTLCDRKKDTIPKIQLGTVMHAHITGFLEKKIGCGQYPIYIVEWPFCVS